MRPSSEGRKRGGISRKGRNGALLVQPTVVNKLHSVNRSITALRAARRRHLDARQALQQYVTENTAALARATLRPLIAAVTFGPRDAHTGGQLHPVAERDEGRDRPPKPKTTLRLQRALARAGVTSRRKAEDLIRAGRVRVDGAVATIGMSVDPLRQRVTVDGRAVRAAGPVTWLALNKPVGYVVSRGDPEGRQTVYGLLPNVPGLTYVGRLDVMTSGLLLFTTDGAAAHRLMHPRFAVPRTYWLRVHGRGVDEVRAALARPPAIDGRPVRVVDFRVRPVERSVEVEITLAEGRQRIVRRLAEALGLKVEWLHRVSYGPVRLGRLAEGKYRRLAQNEVEAIERLHEPA